MSSSVGGTLSIRSACALMTQVMRTGETNCWTPFSRSDHQRAPQEMRKQPAAVQGLREPVPRWKLVDHFPTARNLRIDRDRLRAQEVLAHFDPLQALPLAHESNINRILVLTYFRAGSTFLGDLLQQNWRTFYHFEPLHYMREDGRVAEDRVPEALALLSNLFRCNFTNAESYVKWALPERHQFLFRRNRFLWATCRLRPASCFSPDYVSAACRRASVHVMKLTRLDMEHVRRFLADNRDLRVQLVHLVRDPRAVICSRRALDWCNGTACSEPAVLCGQMLRDLTEARRVQQHGLAPLVRLRHEDVSARPELETRQLYDRLDLPYSPAVTKFLRSHTRASGPDGLDPYSTRRNSSSVPFEWRRKLNYEEVVRVQNSCLPVMQRLNYTVVTSPTDMLSYDNDSRTTSPA